MSMTCAHCGCDDDHACDGGCFWISDGVATPCVCSRCYLARYVEVAELRGRGGLDQALTELSDSASLVYDLLGDDAESTGVTERMLDRVPEILAQAQSPPRLSEPVRLWRPGDPI